MKKTRLFATLLCVCVLTTSFLVWSSRPNQVTEPAGSNPLQSAVGGYIEVVVRDSETSAPINSATVQLWQYGVQIGTTKYTTSLGFANMTGDAGGLDVGWYNVTVTKNGYISQYKTNYINWDFDDDYLTFYLVQHAPNSGYIEITVRNQGGTLIPTPYIQVYNTSTGDLLQSGYGDSNGFYNATGLYVGWHDVRVTEPGYIPQIQQNYINWRADDDYLTFYLVPYPPNSGYIEVTVKDNVSVPIASAIVEARNATGYLHASGYTDSNGFYNVTGLAIGWWDITVKKVGFYSDVKQDYINFNGDDDYLYFYLTPKPANSGYIEVYVDGTGGDLSGAYVYAIDMETGKKHMSGFTDVNGFFNVTGCWTGHWYQVVVQCAGYVQQSKSTYMNWNNDDDYLYFYLNPIDPESQSLQVYVRRSTNPAVAVPDAQVELWQSGSKVAEGSTGDWGFFLMDNLNNLTPFTIIASAPSFNTSTVAGVDLTALGFPTAEFTIYLLPLTDLTSYIEVTVRELINTSMKIAGATVTVTFPNATVMVLGTTDANGFFNVTGLDVGWHNVEISLTGYLTQSQYDLINWVSDDDYLTLSLQRISFLTQTLTLDPITPNPDPTGDIDLYWNDVFWETGYKIYRSTSEGTLELIATLAAGVTHYKDVGLTESNANASGFVFYQVIAVNGSQTLASSIESVEVYSFGGGGIPGFEGLFLLLTVTLLIVLYLWKKAKTKPFFVKFLNI